MGVRSHSPPTSDDDDLSDLGSDIEPGVRAPRVVRRESTLKKFCLPDRWLAVVGFFLTVALVLGATLGTSLHRKKPFRTTGHYPSSAPFREVIHSNFPDPALLHHNGTWYVYASNRDAGIIDKNNNIIENSSNLPVTANIQLATSPNLRDWKIHEAANSPLQELGKWSVDTTSPAMRSDIWAPDILARPDGKFVLYYSAPPAAGGIHCVGASVGDSPTASFKPEPEPVACHREDGGAIDPAPFTDEDGTVYLVYKIDGNNIGNGGGCRNTIPPLKDTPILIQKMEKDGITKSSEAPVKILDRIDDDGPLVEAPSLIRNDGLYILFFSTGCTFDTSYNLKYATSTNITGPFTRGKTLLHTALDGLDSPGSASIVRDGKKWRIAFHGRVFDDEGRGIRPMYVADLKIDKDDVTMEPLDNV
jgi:beta-xylosidase